MKRNTIVAIALGAILLTGVSFAEPPVSTVGQRPSKEESIGMLGGAGIGALAGGPIGLILGVALGGWIGDHMDQQKEEAKLLAQARDQVQREADALNAKLEASDRAAEALSLQLESSRERLMALDEGS